MATISGRHGVTCSLPLIIYSENTDYCTDKNDVGSENEYNASLKHVCISSYWNFFRTSILPHIIPLNKLEVKSFAFGVGGNEFDSDFIAQRIFLAGIFTHYGIEFLI